MNIETRRAKTELASMGRAEERRKGAELAEAAVRKGWVEAGVWGGKAGEQMGPFSQVSNRNVLRPESASSTTEKRKLGLNEALPSLGNGLQEDSGLLGEVEESLTFQERIITNLFP